MTSVVVTVVLAHRAVLIGPPDSPLLGGQVHFDVDGDDYYVDLLFFHMDENRYVVVEMRFPLRATSSRAGMGRTRRSCGPEPSAD